MRHEHRLGICRDRVTVTAVSVHDRKERDVRPAHQHGLGDEAVLVHL